MPDRIETSSEEIKDENPWWRYKHDEIILPNGEKGDYYYCETDGAVIVVPFLPNNKLGLILQYRYISGKQGLEFPGGGVDPELSVEESARTELREETGFVAGEMTKIGTFQPDAGLVDDFTHVFLAEIEQKQQQDLESGEQIEVRERRVDEFQEMITRNEIWHGQTLAAWSLVSPYLYQSENENNEVRSPSIKRILEQFFR